MRKDYYGDMIWMNSSLTFWSFRSRVNEILAVLGIRRLEDFSQFYY